MDIAVVARDPRRAVIDRFLLLCAAQAMEEAGARKPMRVLTQKILFQTQRRLGSEGFRAPGYKFIRDSQGPFSPRLTQDLKQLASLGILQGQLVLPTDRGAEIVKAYRPALVSGNERVFQVVGREAATRARWTAKKAITEVYRLRVAKVDEEMGWDAFDDEAGPRTVSMREVPRGAEFDFGGDKDIAVDDDVLRDLAFDLAMGGKRIRASRSFQPEIDAKVHGLLGG